MARLHLVEHLEPLQHPIGARNQRFADMKARAALALEKENAHTLLCDERGCRRAGRAAADDDDLRIWLSIVEHSGLSQSRNWHSGQINQASQLRPCALSRACSTARPCLLWQLYSYRAPSPDR